MMTDLGGWRRKNSVHRLANRLRHPWPIYRKVGGINAVVNHADGTHTDLGRVSDTYMKRWGVEAK